jgi:hypothetical protein
VSERERLPDPTTDLSPLRPPPNLASVFDEGRFEREMRLVNDDERGVGFLAPGERLDAAHLDRLLAIRAGVVPLHHADAVNSLGCERSEWIRSRQIAWAKGRQAHG